MASRSRAIRATLARVARRAISPAFSRVKFWAFVAGLRRHRLAKQMIQRVTRNADRQFFGVRPIHLQDLPGTMRLRKDHFRSWPMRQLPLPHPPLKRSQLRHPHLLGANHQQMLKQRLGFQLWGRPQTGFRRRPNLGQRIIPRAPIPRRSWLAQPLRVIQILPRRLPIHPAFDCTHRNTSAPLKLGNEPSPLLCGDHVPAVCPVRPAA